MKKEKRSDTDTIFLEGYSFEFTPNGKGGVLCISDDEGTTGKMLVDIKKINQFIKSYNDLKEKIIDNKLSEPYFKKKYNLYERELLKKEVMQDSKRKGDI